MSPIPRDYRDHRNPRMFSYEILVEFIRVGVTNFTSTDVAKVFNVPLAEACTRINTLKRYNCVRVVQPKSHPAVYEITEWGHRYIERKTKEEGGEE